MAARERVIDNQRPGKTLRQALLIPERSQEHRIRIPPRGRDRDGEAYKGQTATAKPRGGVQDTPPGSSLRDLRGHAGVDSLLNAAGRDPTRADSHTPSPQVIETRLTAAERVAIFDTVWQTINDGYFDPAFGGKDWQAIGDEYRQRLATLQDDDTFWRQVLNPMLWELGVSHLAALPPELATLIDRMTFATGSLGMDVRLLDGTGRGDASR